MTNPTQAFDTDAYLKGCTFPCGRQDIINAGQKNNASPEIQGRFQKLPERRYQGIEDVNNQLRRGD